MEADHAGRRPVGQKCDDTEAIPLCTQHHADRHAFSGPFRSFDRDVMREWLDARIEETQVTVTANRAGVGGFPF